ncbi:biliverdin-producing heme oxygenase [Prosthecomicrobium sp. N25]|uniref:biliverdin-producing heme oxygenase n=1 Tax=Prosthecomicrobium sp. N25 TaxID=3129254 RepID=UPI003077109B
MPQFLTYLLRQGTAQAHAHLEARLALLDGPADRARIRGLLARFHGFHAAWEPALARHDALRPVLAGRSRLPHLARDLGALGLDPAALAALPACPGAAGLAATLPAAVGSLYVVEGSTLGGTVIARALAKAPWLPAGGLAFFHPYGRETGPRWQALKAWIDGRGDDVDHAEAVAAAVRTFGLLAEWLDP